MNSKNTFLKVVVPDGARWDKEVQKATHEALPYYVSNFEDATFEEKALILFSRKPFQNISATKMAVRSLITDISKSMRDVSEVKLRSFQCKGTFHTIDPFPLLVESGDVVPTGHGKFIYRGNFNRIFEGLDKVLRDLCEKEGATPETYPSTVQTQTLLESGYLKLHPHLAYLASPIKLDVESLKAIGDIKFDDPDERETSVQHLGVPDQILAPTVCYHTFESRKGQKMGKSRITALNKCHRHEPVGVQSLSRLTTYWMREFIAFGEDEELQEILTRFIDWTGSFLERLDISYAIVSANDPFFGTEGSGNRIMQSAFMLKREIKVDLGNGQTAAIASFNHHQSSLCEKFSISSPDATKKKVSSCCVGWGFERLLYAIYSRHGPDVEAWPKDVQLTLHYR